jgi:ring-1,2-phenylacetyl-CoA epoxidase subunit PaaE
MSASLEQIRRLRITSRHWETPDTASFALEPADGHALTYLPGQFISLIFNVNGHEKRRAYSFSSNPDTDAWPVITVKRIPNGEFSNWLLHHAEPGAILEATEPAGRFLLPAGRTDAVVYIAAGSGITPVMSHLKTLLAGDGPDILLLYANRDSQSTIFKDQLDRWMQAYPDRFTCLYLMSREKTGVHSLERHLNNEILETLLTGYFRSKRQTVRKRYTHFYLCAPTAMMRMAAMTLRVMNVAESSIHKEVFQPDNRLPVRTPDPSRLHTIRVEAKGTTLEFQAFEGETILNAALRQGIALPYSCKSGICFTCLARCTHGEVDINFVDTTKREGPGQMVYTCIGYAASEVVVGLRYNV